MRATRRSWAVALEVVIAAAAAWYIGRALVRQWRAFRGQPLVAHPRWTHVIVASLVVLATYALLVQTWRVILRSWNDRLRFLEAARIWAVSNLARYIPGTFWTIGVMAAMAQRQQISPVAATGSSLLNVVVNIACGIAVAIAAGWSALDVLSGGHVAIGVALMAAITIGVLSLPFVLPVVMPRLASLIGRDIGAVRLPARAVAVAIAGNVVAWLLYGIAFRLLVSGVLGQAAGTTADYMAVFASSYVIGYLFFFLPAGVGPRDAAMATALTALHLTSPAQAALVAVSSRIWLTVLELLPGLVFFAVRPRRDRTPSADPKDVTT